MGHCHLPDRLQAFRRNRQATGDPTPAGGDRRVVSGPGFPHHGGAATRRDRSPIFTCGRKKNGQFAEKTREKRISSLDIGGRFRDALCVAKKPTSTKEKYSKTQILDQIAESTELSRKQVAAVLDGLTDVIEAHVNKRSVGEFVLPGLLKITTVRKPAVKARKGINPFTKEEVMFKAKPATTVVKVRPLKKLKDMAL